MKHWLTIVLIVALAFLNARAYLHAGVPYTHDGENHLARFANYKIALREGQFPPRFAPNLMNHYGYPVFNYNYPLANILSVPLSFIKVPYNLTFKLIMTAAFVFGLLGIWQVGRRWNIPYSGVWLAITLYGLMPYIAAAIIFRGNIGEVLVYGLLPWLIWSIERLRQPATKVTLLVCLGLCTAFLLAHNVSVLFISPVLALYAMVRYQRDWKAWKQLLVVGITAVLLSLWFWLPALAEKTVVVLDQAGLSVGYADHFVTLSQFVFSPQTFGFSYIGSVDSLSFNVGLAALFVWIVSWLLVVKLKVRSVKTPSTFWPVALFWLLTATISLTLQLQQSEWLWSVLPFVRFIQLPWRLGLLWTVAVPMIALWAYRYWPRWVKVVTWLFLAFSALALLRIHPIDYRYLTNVDLEAFSQSTTTMNENLPTTFTYLNIADWQPTATLLSGSGSVAVNYWKGSDRQYQLNLTEPAVIAEPTMLFPGWQTTITSESGESRNVKYLVDEQTQGRLAYALEPGVYQVRSQFTQWTWARVVGNTVSGITLLAVLAWALFARYDQKSSR